jgi:hypothetical protein
MLSFVTHTAAKVRGAVEGGVDAGRKQRVALLYCIERVTPLLNGSTMSQP